MTDLPWISEAKKHVGLQEVRDRVKLMAYFKTAGQNYDPSKTPWCGIFQAAVFHTVLPSQKLVVNPAWARNWLGFGVICSPQVGSLLVFERDGGGHVTLCLGQYNGDFVCLGGNQNNSVNISLRPKTGFLGARWPDAFSPAPTGDLPVLNAAGFKLLTSEA